MQVRWWDSGFQCGVGGNGPTNAAGVLSCDVSFSGNHAGTAGGGMVTTTAVTPSFETPCSGKTGYKLCWYKPFHFNSDRHQVSVKPLEDCNRRHLDSGCGLEIGDTNLPDADPLFIDPPDPADAPHSR